MYFPNSCLLCLLLSSPTLFWFIALSAISFKVSSETACAYFKRFNETYYTFLQCCECSPFSIQISSWPQHGNMMFIGASNIYKDMKQCPDNVESNRYSLYATQVLSTKRQEVENIPCFILSRKTQTAVLDSDCDKIKKKQHWISSMSPLVKLQSLSFGNCGFPRATVHGFLSSE